MKSFILVVAATALAGCVSPPDTKPSAMTAPEHEAAAAEHRERAADAAEKYDPSADRMEVATAPDGTPGIVMYNPTDSFKQIAAKELAEAKAHEKAAAKLASSEEAACASVPKEARGACPLIGTLSALEPLKNGARVKLRDATMTAPLVARMKCHAAFAAKNGDAGLEMCPLYVPGLKVDVDGEWISLRSDAPGAASQLVKLLTEHLPATPTSTSTSGSH